jgi:tetratricopeptide (TPR) repeat protein
MRTTCKNRSLLFSCISFLLGSFLMIPFSARAQSQSASSTQTADSDACLTEARCTELYESARRLSQAGQYDAALVTYQSAYAASKASWLLINIGRMQQKTGKPQQAVATYQRFLKEPITDEETQTKAREYLIQAQQEAQPVQLIPLVQPVQSMQLVQPARVSPPAARPLHKKWWLWTAVGAGAAVLAVGLGAGLASRAANVPSVPEGASVWEPRF